MKKLFTILMLFPVLLFGQLEKNNVYAEAHVGIFTQVVMNYERKIFSGEKVSWYGRLGGGYGVNYSDGLLHDKLGWGGLAAVSLLTGENNNHFELNAGAFLGFDNDFYDESPDAIPNQVETEKFISPIFNIGYRYQKPDGGS